MQPESAIRADDLRKQMVKYNLVYKYECLKMLANISHANGCGAKGGIKFPDTMYFVNVSAACCIHDIEWELAEHYQDLLDANERFDNNLKSITDAESSNNLMTWLRRSRISKYVSGVELVGTDAYAEERGFAAGV